MLRVLSAILFFFPIHLLFIKIKNCLYDKGILSPHKVGATVISVGNISLGGTGKTPFTIALSNFLAKNGKSVGVLTRGYKREGRGNFLFTNHSIEDVGDEAMVLKNNLSGEIPIFVSTNKILGSEKLVSLGCDTIVLDDAFQHRKIYRDIDIVLVGPDELNKNKKKVFPWGALREPFYNINRADIIITNKINLYDDTPVLKNSLSLGVEFEEELLSTAEHNTNINQLSKIKKILSISGIGNPENFHRSLSVLKVDVAKRLVYRDHHTFNDKDISNIIAHIKKHKIEAIVCTEKDWVKLELFKEKINVPIYAVRLKHVLNDKIKESILRLL